MRNLRRKRRVRHVKIINPALTIYKRHTINFAFLYRLRHNGNKRTQAQIRFEKRRVEYYCGHRLKTNKFAILCWRQNDSHRKNRRTYRYYV